ncbi:hypothetical protein ES703_91433 [subsurface metagenome]
MRGRTISRKIAPNQARTVCSGRGVIVAVSFLEMIAAKPMTTAEAKAQISPIMRLFHLLYISPTLIPLPADCQGS